MRLIGRVADRFRTPDGSGIGPVPEAKSEVIRRNGWAMTFVCITLGVGIALSRPEQWSTPVWRDALLMPGAPPTWGVIILFAGLLLLFGNVRAQSEQSRIFHFGWVIALGWFGLVDGLQLHDLVDDVISSFQHGEWPTANPVGVVMWTWAAYLCAERLRLASAKSYLPQPKEGVTSDDDRPQVGGAASDTARRGDSPVGDSGVAIDLGARRHARAAAALGGHAALLLRCPARLVGRARRRGSPR